MARVVLVTGVSQDLGARFARALAASGTAEVIGLDITPPQREMGEVSYVRADLSSPILHKILRQREVDTVVHMAVGAQGRSRAAVKEANVIGSMQLLAACLKVTSLRKLVFASSSVVYGSGPLDPARFTESMGLRSTPRRGFAKDVVEVEDYVRGINARRPEVCVSIARLANLMGAGVHTPLSRYLSLPVVAKPMGFDARLQFLHPVDAANALIYLTENDLRGTFNIGADDIVTLTQALRIMGRPTIGVWNGFAPMVLAMSHKARVLNLTTEELHGLTWGRVMDTSLFVERSQLRPHYSSRRAIEEFAAMSTPGLWSIDRVDGLLESTARMLAPSGQHRG